jgi:hypothetical protein
LKKMGREAEAAPLEARAKAIRAKRKQSNPSPQHAKGIDIGK